MCRRCIMCRVNVTEFRNNISHYIELCLTEDVHVTKNGEIVAVLSGPDRAYYQALIRLCGCLKENDNGQDYNEMIGEEIMKKCGY